MIIPHQKFGALKTKGSCLTGSVEIITETRKTYRILIVSLNEIHYMV